MKIGSGGTAEAGGEDAVDPVDLNKDGKTDGDDVPQVGDTRVRLYFSDNVEGDDPDHCKMSMSSRTRSETFSRSTVSPRG